MEIHILYMVDLILYLCCLLQFYLQTKSELGWRIHVQTLYPTMLPLPMHSPTKNQKAISAVIKVFSQASCKSKEVQSENVLWLLLLLYLDCDLLPLSGFGRLDEALQLLTDFGDISWGWGSQLNSSIMPKCVQFWCGIFHNTCNDNWKLFVQVTV